MEQPKPCVSDEYAGPTRVVVQARYNITQNRWELIEFDRPFITLRDDVQVTVLPELGTVVARDVVAQTINTLYDASAADWIFDWDSEGCVEIMNALVGSVATAIAGNFERTEENTNPYRYYEAEEGEDDEEEGE